MNVLRVACRARWVACLRRRCVGMRSCQGRYLARSHACGTAAAGMPPRHTPFRTSTGTATRTGRPCRRRSPRTGRPCRSPPSARPRRSPDAGRPGIARPRAGCCRRRVSPWPGHTTAARPRHPGGRRRHGAPRSGYSRTSGFRYWGARASSEAGSVPPWSAS